MTSKATSIAGYDFDTLRVTLPYESVYQVELHRPLKSNALAPEGWADIKNCFQRISSDSACRVVILSGAGSHFCAGIDLKSFADILQTKGKNADPARNALKMRSLVLDMQGSFNAIEKCSQPVIAAIQGACIGAGVDMITACDIRLCTADANFQIKEVDIGLAADVGTLQRLPKIVGNDSMVRELAYTARSFSGETALKLGLVSRVVADLPELSLQANLLAQEIASKSPVAIVGTKLNLIYSRDHSVQEGLAYMATWNGAMLQSEDLIRAVGAAVTKTQATFSKL